MKKPLTLDSDVAKMLREETLRSGRPVKAIVNEVLRRGLDTASKPPRFSVNGHSFGFKPGIDLDRLNQLDDDLEATESSQADGCKPGA